MYMSTYTLTPYGRGLKRICINSDKTTCAGLCTIFHRILASVKSIFLCIDIKSGLRI